MIETLAAWSTVLGFVLNVADRVTQSKSTRRTIRDTARTFQALSPETTISTAESLLAEGFRTQLGHDADSVLLDLQLLRQVLEEPVKLHVPQNDPWGVVRYGSFLFMLTTQFDELALNWRAPSRWGRSRDISSVTHYYLGLPNTTQVFRRLVTIQNIFDKGFLNHAELTKTFAINGNDRCGLNFAFSTLQPASITLRAPSFFPGDRTPFKVEDVVIFDFRFLYGDDDYFEVRRSYCLTCQELARPFLASHLVGRYTRYQDRFSPDGTIAMADPEENKPIRVSIDHVLFAEFLYGICADLLYYSALVRQEASLGRQAISGLLGRVSPPK